MIENSVTHRVLEATPVPAEVIAGDAVPKRKRWSALMCALSAGGLLLALD